jgi:very-short-patch-repair endonuclease
LEANEVAKAVIEHIRYRKKESIGIVAMNLQQADLIEDCIEKLLKADPVIQNDWDEFEAANQDIFVKNLENVQGDERDVIYISITFGPNEHGVIHKTFGPITGATGWRRLNVLYTRARKRIHVYSSMSGSEIDLLATASVGSRALKDYLTFAETSRLPTEVETGRSADSPFESDVEAALLQRGFESVKQLGVAGFFLDLAIRHPQQRGSYILGVECDGAAYHSSKCARDRDRLRQEVLEGMGWQIHRIWSTDWFRDPHNEVQVLVKKLEKLLHTSDQSTARSSVDLVSESANDVSRFVLSIPAKDWFYAAKWAKQNDFLSG